ncbi:MAG TPA: DoxX-like family protein [Thermoanaerobaculia bacterium]|nr:DoxX-like family protein [Thermoanaerobaculia bacterium]
MPIFVETLVRASMDDVWRATQDPALHQRWDLRFSEIEYLPRESDADPVRFLYRTRIGLGLGIAGEGESVAERDGRDGSRTSVLRFWSPDPKSLIAVGSGYWKYTPAPDGVRFSTLYDYETRFGAAGRLIDRLLFRPLMAWATAWSFDRLRLWIERGRTPEESMRIAVVEAVARVTLAAIWIYQGLVPKLLFPDSGELAITDAVAGGIARAPLLVALLAAAEIAVGIALLLFGRSQRLVVLSTVAVVVMTLVAVVSMPVIATTPFNAVTLTAAMAALGVVVAQTMPLVPRAAHTRWSSRRRTG